MYKYVKKIIYYIKRYYRVKSILGYGYVTQIEETPLHAKNVSLELWIPNSNSKVRYVIHPNLKIGMYLKLFDGCALVGLNIFKTIQFFGTSENLTFGSPKPTHKHLVQLIKGISMDLLTLF